MYFILSWRHKHKQIFAIACLFIGNKFCVTDLNISPDEYSRQRLHNLLFFDLGSLLWILSTGYFITDSKQYSTR